MASTRMKKGKWYYRITLSSNGERKYIERGSFDTEAEAREAGELYEKRLKFGEKAFIPTKITYRDMVDEWLVNYAPTVYKESTIQSHKKILNNYILPEIGDCYVYVIDTKTLQTIINNETPKHTLNGLNKIRVCIRGSFNYAVLSGYIREDPSNRIKMPKIRSVYGQMLKPTREQKACQKELVDAIFERFPEGHSCYIPLLLGYRCGLRLGEVYALLIEDFDKVNKKLYVRRQIQYNEYNQLYFSDLKYCDPGEYRVIDLDTDTCKILSRHVTRIMAARPVMNHKQYYITDGNIVSETEGIPIYFMNVRLSDGSYISPRTMRHVSRVIHGLDGKFDYVDKDWDFHMFRHTHASECIAAGMPPESVQKRLGHKNLTTTYNFYVHETDIQAERAKRVLEGMYA